LFAKDFIRAGLLPLEILFAEHHSTKFALLRVSTFALSGIPLRQVWTWMALLLVAAYSSNIKSTLIKQPEQKLISQYQDIPSSGIPVHFVTQGPAEFEALQYSPYYFDQWLYANSDDVLYWSEQ